MAGADGEEGGDDVGVGDSVGETVAAAAEGERGGGGEVFVETFHCGHCGG